MKKKNKGFTLAELLIVVAIIAVLAMIAIAVFTSSLKKSEEATCEANCRSLYSEAMAAYILNDEDTLQALMAVYNGTNTSGAYVCPSGGKISLKFDAATGKVTVSCSEHGEGANFGQPETFENIKEIIQGNLGNVTPIDSGAASSSGTKAAAIVKALEEAGLDLNTLGATGWRYTKDNIGNPVFYWTPVDLDTLSVGTTIPVMRYNFESGNYTVWNVTVGNNGSYNTLNKVGSMISSSDTSTQTYEGMLKVYEQAVAGNS